MSSSKNSHILLHLAFLLALVAAQYATTVHASIHDFHEHTEICDVFHAMERSADTLTTSASITPQIPLLSIQIDYHAICGESVPPRPRSRSPPLSL